MDPLIPQNKHVSLSQSCRPSGWFKPLSKAQCFAVMDACSKDAAENSNQAKVETVKVDGVVQSIR